MPRAPAPAAAPAHISVQSQTDEPSRQIEPSTSTFREETNRDTGTPPGASQAAKRKSLFPSPSPRKSIHDTNTATTPVLLRPEENAKRPRLDIFLGSPFYPGQTMYGGASASRMYMREPNIISRRTPIVTPPLCNDNNSVSTAVSRMEKLLEKYSSSLNESKRTPQVRTNASDLNSSVLGSTISPSRNLPKLQELRTSHTAMMLNIKRRARLRDSTQAARQIYMSHSSTVTPDPTKSIASLGGYGTSNMTNKIKSHIGKSQARRNATNFDDEIVPPLNLPSMALPITNLPQFSFTNTQNAFSSTPIDGPSSQKKDSREESSNKTPTFIFSKPIPIAVSENHIPVDATKFTFRKPEQLVNLNEDTQEQISAKTTFNSIDPKLTENAVVKTKDWKCNDCWIMNKPDILKCAACGGAKSSLTPKPAAITDNCSSKEKDWKCNDCWVNNKPDIQKCVACGGAKPTSGPKPPAITDNCLSKEKDWKCNDCWVNNKPDIQKCVACGGSKPISGPKPPAITDNCLSKEKDWKCNDCWVMNKPDVPKCVACSGAKPTVAIKPLGSNENTVSMKKDWKCNDCWVNNKPDIQKCVACGGANSEPNQIFSTINTAANEKDWKCNDCWVMNKPDIQKCVACGGAKPSLAPKPLDNSAQKEKDWKCNDCWVMNKPDVSKCVACGGAKPNLISKPLTITENSFPKGNDWKCTNCWVMNKSDVSKCVACSGSKPSNNNSTPVTNDSPNTKTPSLFNSQGFSSFNKEEKKSDDDSIFVKIMEKQNQRWECQSCLSRNDSCHIKCACCEAPKPGSNVNEEKAKFNFSATPTFKFGIQAKTDSITKEDVVDSSENKSTSLFKIEPNNNVGPKSDAPFSFGIAAAKTTTENKRDEDKISTSEPKFAFGIPSQSKTETAKEAFKPFTPVLPNTTIDNKTAKNKEKASTPDTKFIFGVPNKSNLPAKDTFKLPENNLLTLKTSTSDAKTLVAITAPLQNVTSAGKTAVVTPAVPALGQTTANATSEPKLTMPSNLFNFSTPNKNEVAKPAVTEIAATKAEGFAAFKPVNANAPFSFSANLSKTSETAASNVSKPLFSFASNTPKTTANTSLPAATTSAFPVFQAKSDISFSAPSATSQPLASTTAVFSFGSNAPTTLKPAAATPSRYNFSFGATSNTSTVAPTFNATFGASTTADSSATSNNNGPLMPSTNNLFGSPQPPKSNLFGGISTMNNQKSDLSVSFGASNDTKPAPFAFSAPSNTFNAPVFGAGQQQSANIFGMGNQTQTPASQSGGLFGNPAQNSAPVPTLFGGLQNSNAPPTGMFGAPSLGTTPTFGAPNATLATPTFGAPNATSATPTFGAPNTSLTTSPFGAPNSSATPTFGALSASTTFGAPNMPAPAGPPPAYNFGAASTTPMFAFAQQSAAQPGVNTFGAGTTMQFNMGTSAGPSQQSNIANRRVRKAVRRTTQR